MMLDPVEATVVVNASQKDAFARFTDGINDWWPVATHSIAQGTVVMQAELGGEIIETAQDGSTHVWGHVTDWNPPEGLQINWYVGRTSAQATQIAVNFIPTDDGRTGVTLRHTGWEALGETALKIREGYAGGWISVLGTHYAEAVEEHCAPVA